MTDFETGVTKRREIPIHDPFEFVLLGEPTNVVGIHLEERTHATTAHSSLGNGGPLTVPKRERCAILVTENGERVEVSHDHWERMRMDVLSY